MSDCQGCNGGDWGVGCEICTLREEAERLRAAVREFIAAYDAVGMLTTWAPGYADARHREVAAWRALRAVAG